MIMHLAFSSALFVFALLVASASSAELPGDFIEIDPIPRPDPNDNDLIDTYNKTIVCGRGNRRSNKKPCPEGLKRTVLNDEIHEIRCCRDCSGATCEKPWKEKCPDYSLGLSATSKVEGECKRGTFTEARRFCSSIDGRLCTPLEMENRCAKNTGCRFNRHLIWTCAYDGHACDKDSECCGECVDGTCVGEDLYD